VALAEAEGAAGAPWDRPLAGALDKLVVESELLAGNPLGDSARRPLWIYRPPGVERDHPRPLPAVYVLQGYTGQVVKWGNREPFELNFVERLDAMFAAGECPDALVVLVDAWTAYGGSQFLDSSSTGAYQSYLCDEVVPFVDEAYPAIPSPAGRGVAGKSSGGYGAMVVPMMRPGLFGALATHAGDAEFLQCYASRFAAVARTLRDEFEGSYDVFFRELAAADPFTWKRFGQPLEMYAYAACYSPDPEEPGKALLPFDLETGRIVEDVWERWLALDPVRMAASAAGALAGMSRILVEAGRSDEYFLDMGATAFSKELTSLGIEHTFELFEGAHGGMTHRYAPAIRELVLALDTA
jgi:S-formylglutathione hydrolase FrmB